MNTQSDALPEPSAESQVLAMAQQPRPLYWSVRRELWENRSIYAAPLSVAAVILSGFLIRAHRLPQTLQSALTMDPEHQRHTIILPYDVAAALILLTAILVGSFYCLDALYGERRDRSILFWKSLPVSDLTTVLAKVSIPLVVLPAFIFVLIVATQIIMLLINTMVLAGHGLSATPLWTQLKFSRSTLALMYGLTTITLWHAPIYSWFLLVSAWARRTAFLWAVLPFFILAAVEKIAFNTHHLLNLIVYRLFGWFSQGFTPPLPKGAAALDPLDLLTPTRFFATPGLWLGLIAAALFLFAAARMRRQREPI